MRNSWIFLLLLLILRCSNSGSDSSITPDYRPEQKLTYAAVDSGRRTILAIGTIQINDVSGHPCPETIEIAFLPNRELAAHWNVTPMLMPPHCDDCVKIEVLEFKPAQKYIKLKVSLRNPTDLTGYDVRGIAVVPSVDVRLLNSDGWTELWDDGGVVTRNPYKAFAIDWPDHEFEPGTSHQRVCEFTFSSFNQLVDGTQFVVDTSWPGHCPEAYWFDGVHKEGHIDGETSSADFIVSLTPQDWQGDISTVLINLTEIGGGIEPMILSGNDWAFSYEASVVVPDTPRTNIWAEVVDSITPISAFWLFEIPIVNEDPSLPVPTGINAAPGEVYVDLTWDAIDDPDVVGVNVYRRGKGGVYKYGSPLNYTPITVEAFKDSAVERNVMYYYVLRIVGQTGVLGPISVEVGGKPFEWGPQFQLSNYDYSGSVCPDMMVGSDSLSRVVWRDYGVTGKYQYADILEVNYTPDIAIFDEPPGHSIDATPRIAVGSNNIPYYYGANDVGGDWVIVIHTLSEDLAASEEYVYFGDEGPIVWQNCACVDDNGTFWIAYVDPNIPYPIIAGVYIRSLTPDWVLSEPELISPQEYQRSSGQIAGLACDETGELHCAFRTIVDQPPMNTYQLFYTRTVDKIWQPAEQATDLPDYATTNWQRFDIDSLGKPYIIYSSVSNYPPLIEMVTRDVDGWEVIDIFPEYPTCSSLAITIDDDDNVNVFVSPFGEPWEIGFRRGYNGSWSPTYQISSGFKPGDIGILSFQIIADYSPSGAISFVWEQDMTHIYARRMLE